MKSEGEKQSGGAVASKDLLARCASCALWQPAPTEVPGCTPEKICGGTRNMSFGMYGQDGRSVITTADFGCIHYRPNSEVSGAGATVSNNEPKSVTRQRSLD